MKRFYNNRNLDFIFHLFNLFATLLLFWHFSFFTIALKSFSHLYAISKSIFSNSFYVFLLLHAIILSIYILSNQNDDVSTVIYNQYLKITSSSELVNADPVESLPEKQLKDPVEFSPEKQQDSCNSELVIDRVESWLQNFCNSEVGDSSLYFEETVTEEPVMAVTETAVTETTTTTCCTTMTTTGDSNFSEEKCYRRVQSECFERSVVVTDQQRELKRFNTCLKREPHKSLCYVEELSKEEFNQTVEDFIAKHKRLQREEEQSPSQKTGYLALPPC